MVFVEKLHIISCYNPLSLTFLCTGEFAEKRILDNWNNLIVDSTQDLMLHIMILMQKIVH